MSGVVPFFGDGKRDGSNTEGKVRSFLIIGPDPPVFVGKCPPEPLAATNIVGASVTVIIRRIVPAHISANDAPADWRLIGPADIRGMRLFESRSEGQAI